jgi:hypothetical protein
VDQIEPGWSIVADVRHRPVDDETEPREAAPGDVGERRPAPPWSSRTPSSSRSPVADAARWAGAGDEGRGGRP